MIKMQSYTDYTVSLFWAHVFSIGVAIPLFLLTGGLHMLIWGFPSIMGGIGWGWIGLLLILSIAIHELLHAVGFVYAGGASWRDIRFGVMWKALAPYAHCKTAARVSTYRLAIALPGFVLGVAPALAGLATGVDALTLYGYIMLIAACGDAVILWAIRTVPAAALVIDHPSKVGCMVVSGTSVLPDERVLPETEEENIVGVYLLTLLLFVLGLATGFFILYPAL